MKTPEQIEAEILRLMLQTTAIELALCATTSVLTREQMDQIRARMAVQNTWQELAAAESATGEVLQPVQAAADRVHQRMQQTWQKFQPKG